MEEAAKAIKKFAKRIGKSFAKRVLPPMIAVLLVVIIISGSTYVVMKWIAKKVAKATSPYTSSINISDDGTVTTDVSAQELWDDMIKQGYDVDKYLDTPEELAKLLNAEIVTQLPDMRKDVTKDIDWDDVLDKMFSDKKTDKESDEDTGDVLQGVIKFKRHDENGNEYYLTYAKPGQFQEWIEAYHKTGNERAKQNVLTHFTLKKSPKASNNSVISGSGSFTHYNLSEEDLKTIAVVCVNENGEGAGATAEASLIANRYEMYGDSYSSIIDYLFNCGWFAGATGSGSCSNETLEDIRKVLNEGKRTLPKYVDEHVTLSAQWVLWAKNSDGYIANVEDRTKYRRYETLIKQEEAQLGGGTYTFYCFPTEGADPFGYTSEENRQKYGDFCYEYGTWQPINGTEDPNATDVKASEEKSGSSTNSNNSTSNGSIVEVAEKIWKDHVWHSGKEYGGSSVPCTGNTIDCSSFVSWVLYEYGYKDFAGDQKVTQDFYLTDWNAKYGWYEIPLKGGENPISKLQPGDIIVRDPGNNDGHVTFVAEIKGDQILCYDCGNRANWQERSVNGEPIDRSYMLTDKRTGKVIRVSGEGSGNSSGSGAMDLAKLALDYSCTASGCKYPGLNDELSRYDAVFDGSRIHYKGAKDPHKRIEVSATQKMLEIHDAMTEKFPPLKNGWYASCSPYVAAMVAYLDIDPDIASVNGIIGSRTQDDYYPTSPYFEQIQLDPSKTYAEQCQPGDILTIKYGDAPNSGGHVMVYVGNELAQQYFPGTDGGMVEAAENGQCYPGVTNKDIKNPQNPRWHCFRPIGGSNGYGQNGGTFGYQAVIGTWRQVDKTTDAKGPNVEDAAKAFGVTIEEGTTYSISTRTINYENLVQPYTLQFDLLWALLVLGQDKSFVMDLADLAYGSDIEVSIFDNLTTTTDIDNCEYTEATDGIFSGKVSYTVSGGSTYTKDIGHNHLYANNDALSEENGHIYKTVVTKDNTVTTALTKADTWIADYEATYEKLPEETSEQNGSITLKDQLISGPDEGSISDDKCSDISDAIDDIVKDANDEIDSINSAALAEEVGNSTASGTGGTESSSTSSLSGSNRKLTLDEEKIFGSPENNANLLSKISADDVDTSDVKVTLYVNRVNCVDNTTDIVVTKKYTEKKKNAKIKDDKKTEPNFVTLFNSYKHRQNKNNILSATEWLFEIMEENEKLESKLDLMKYLLYKATDINYGVTEIDEELFYPGALSNVGENDISVVGIDDEVIKTIIKRAKSMLGTPYVLGSQTSSAIDCSGLVNYAYTGELGAHGPGTDTMINWPEVPSSQAKPGDSLVIRYNGGASGHVALIIDNMDIIEANGKEVAINTYKSFQDFINKGYKVVRPPEGYIKP